MRRLGGVLTGEALWVQALHFEREIRAVLQARLSLVRSAGLPKLSLEDLFMEFGAQLIQMRFPRRIFRGEFKRRLLQMARTATFSGLDASVPCATPGPVEVSSCPTRTDSEHREIALIVQAIQRLPDLTRQIFTLRKVYQYPQPRIAEHLNVSMTEVERHLTIAAQAVTRALNSTDEESVGALPMSEMPVPLAPGKKERVA